MILLSSPMMTEERFEEQSTINRPEKVPNANNQNATGKNRRYRGIIWAMASIPVAFLLGLFLHLHFVRPDCSLMRWACDMGKAFGSDECL